MGFTESYEIISRRINLSHISNLYAIAFVDGRFHEKEKDFIQLIATKSGITQKDLDEMLQNPERIAFCPPFTKDEKLSQLIDMINLAMVDDEINKNEIALCIYYAVKLGLSECEVNLYIKDSLYLESMRQRLVTISHENREKSSQ
jgi:hypothetical protein